MPPGRVGASAAAAGYLRPCPIPPLTATAWLPSGGTPSAPRRDAHPGSPCPPAVGHASGVPASVPGVPLGRDAEYRTVAFRPRPRRAPDGRATLSSPRLRAAYRTPHASAPRRLRMPVGAAAGCYGPATGLRLPLLRPYFTHRASRYAPCAVCLGPALPVARPRRAPEGRATLSSPRLRAAYRTPPRRAPTHGCRSRIAPRMHMLHRANPMRGVPRPGPTRCPPAPRPGWARYNCAHPRHDALRFALCA